MFALPISITRNRDEYGSFVEGTCVPPLIIEYGVESVFGFYGRDACSDGQGSGTAHELVVVDGFGPEGGDGDGHGWVSGMGEGDPFVLLFVGG